MKKPSSLFVLTTLMLCAIVTLTFKTSPAFANTLTQLVSGTVLHNTSSQNALTINQNTTAPKGRADGGALLLNNTGNQNTGLNLYSNQATPAQPLMRMEIDNTKWDEEVLYIKSDSPTSRGLIRLDSPAPEIEFVETDQEGASGKFEVRVQHDTFQINSRRADDTTFENKFAFTHEGDLELVSGALKIEGKAPSEFKGGINITGGCLAINGKCLSATALSGATAEKEPAQSDTVANITKAPLSAGTPPALECNSHQERGAIKLDIENGRLYICNGPDRGWDYADLKD